MGPTRLGHAIHNVASVLEPVFVADTGASRYYRDEADAHGVSTSVHLASIAVEMTLRSWRKCMADAFEGKPYIVPEEPPPRDEHWPSRYEEVLTHLQLACRTLTEAEVREMKPEDWHAISSISRAGCVSAMARDGLPLSAMTAHEAAPPGW